MQKYNIVLIIFAPTFTENYTISIFLKLLWELR